MQLLHVVYCSTEGYDNISAGLMFNFIFDHCSDDDTSSENDDLAMDNMKEYMKKVELAS